MDCCQRSHKNSALKSIDLNKLLNRALSLYEGVNKRIINGISLHQDKMKCYDELKNETQANELECSLYDNFNFKFYSLSDNIYYP